jgi:protein-S-isoprenylcysteine O-methyltransferase Ste14
MNAANKLHAWAFVGVQAIILGLLVFLPADVWLTVQPFIVAGTVLEWLGALGIVASAVTIRSSLTAVPLPKEQGKLGTSGLYKYVRHPMYTSVLVLSLGIALLSGNVIKYALVLCLYALFYYKSQYEERYLRQKYPGYEAYAKQTPRFIPFFK